MHRIFSFLLAGILAFLLAGCSPAAALGGEARAMTRSFAYSAVPFAVSIRGQYAGMAETSGVRGNFSATVTYGTPDAEGGRDIRLTFTSPPTLAGLTVSTHYEGSAPGDNPERTVTLSYPSPYGTVTSETRGSCYDGLVRYAEALLPIGNVTGVSPMDKAGVNTVTRTSISGRQAVFTFSKDASLPLRVEVTDTYGTLSLTVAPLQE